MGGRYRLIDMIGAQPTPKDRVTRATESSSYPTCRHASARARSVIAIRAPIASAVSVHDDTAAGLPAPPHPP